MNVLLILGHPRPGSFCHALADAYLSGAIEAQVNIRHFYLYEQKFNLNVEVPSPEEQVAESAVTEAQSLIQWADHIVIVYPTWWGSMPALLKGFIDRVITPGFAFYEISENVFNPLLKGKTAHLITTMDTPEWVYRYILGNPGINSIKKATLNLCGVSPVRTTIFSPVKHSNEKQKRNWLNEAKEFGIDLKNGAITPAQKFWKNILPWIRAIRLQFYPMTWVAYATGAFLAARAGHGLDWNYFWLGYLFIFLVEVATVFSNELFDFDSDRQNKFFGAFNGGSRVLVQKEISPAALWRAVIFILCGVLLTGFLLLVFTPGNSDQQIAIMIVLLVAGLGYTIPPLKFSWRGLGELTVGLTHSLAVILCGFVFQGGNAGSPSPWLLSLPLFLSIIPSITLSGIPDYEADKAAGKRSLAVIVGKNNAAFIALVFTVLASFSGLYFYACNILPGAFNEWMILAAMHGGWLVWELVKYLVQIEKPAQVNRLMIISLLFILWFALVPFFLLK